MLTLTLGLMPILVGLTLAETSQWTDPAVWGTIVAGIVFLFVFIFVESRAAEPIIPLHLFRNRTFSASMVAIFLATFGFGAAIIFLPLYFQIVQGASATLSGYQLLPFLIGLIICVDRLGHRRQPDRQVQGIVVGGLVILAIGLYLMSVPAGRHPERRSCGAGCSWPASASARRSRSSRSSSRTPCRSASSARRRPT